MNKYVVAIANLFDNINVIYKVLADTEVNAMKNALLQTHNNEEDKKNQIEWNESIGNTVEEIQQNCFDSDILISKPIFIDYVG